MTKASLWKMLHSRETSNRLWCPKLKYSDFTQIFKMIMSSLNAYLTNKEKLVCHHFDKVWRHQLRLDCLCIYTIGDRLCVIIVQNVYLFIRVYSRSFLICSLIL